MGEQASLRVLLLQFLDAYSAGWKPCLWGIGGACWDNNVCRHLARECCMDQGTLSGGARGATIATLPVYGVVVFDRVCKLRPPWLLGRCSVANVHMNILQGASNDLEFHAVHGTSAA